MPVGRLPPAWTLELLPCIFLMVVGCAGAIFFPMLAETFTPDALEALTNPTAHAVPEKK